MYIRYIHTYHCCDNYIFPRAGALPTILAHRRRGHPEGGGGDGGMGGIAPPAHLVRTPGRHRLRTGVINEYQRSPHTDMEGGGECVCGVCVYHTMRYGWNAFVLIDRLTRHPPAPACCLSTHQ